MSMYEERCLHSDVCKYGKNRANGLYCSGERCLHFIDRSKYVVREKGEWKPCFICTGRGVDNCMQGEYGWECSVCGERFDTQYDYCVCGADMRKGENNG